MEKMFKIVFVLAVAGGLAQYVYAEDPNEMPMNNKEAGTTMTTQMPMPAAQEPMKEMEAESAMPAVAAPSVVTSPSSEEIKTAVNNYVKEQTDDGGNFDIFDPQTQTMKELSFVKLHDEVGKSGEYSFVCADFTDKNNNDKLDVDFDVEFVGDKLNVVGVKIHRVNDVARYHYDDKYNRVPAVSAGAGEKSNPSMSEKEEGDAPDSDKTVPSGEGERDMNQMHNHNEEAPAGSGY